MTELRNPPLSKKLKLMCRRGKTSLSRCFTQFKDNYLIPDECFRKQSREGTAVVLADKNLIWRDVVGYEGIYKVSNTGVVMSYTREVERRGKIMLMHEQVRKLYDNHGYHAVKLTKDRKQRSYFLHRLIAQAFIPNPDNKPHINHLDINPKNNSIENLEWVTHAENMKHAFECGELDEDLKFIKISVTMPDGSLLSFKSISHASRELTKLTGKSHIEQRISAASLSGKMYHGKLFARLKLKSLPEKEETDEREKDLRDMVTALLDSRTHINKSFEKVVQFNSKWLCK